MSRPAQITNADLTLQMQIGGAATAQGLADRLRVDRSTVARGLARLGDAVVALGAARRARYALRRPVRAVGDRWPIYRVDAAGRASEWARLHALYGGVWIEWASEAPVWAEMTSDREGFLDGFPFFLGDLRPQGFLGRQQARRVSHILGVPEDPRAWGDDDTLVFLQTEGDDLPGNVVVGDIAMRRVAGRLMATLSSIPEVAAAERYVELAALSASGEVPGSSVEGEQPKFTALLTREAGSSPVHVIVKFTDLLTTPTGRRWADLLAAEAHAHFVMRVPGESVSAVRMLDAGGRRFFEIERFDRVGAHGRTGVVSLRSLYDALPDAANATTWLQAAAQLVQAGVIDATAERSIRLRHAFGGLIGNTDMHFGNLSFFLDDALPLRLTPLFDMLPMQWAPTVGNATPMREFAPAPPLPNEQEIWAEAAMWALEFWRRLAEDPAVSAEFVEISRRAGAHVDRMRGLFA